MTGTVLVGLYSASATSETWEGVTDATPLPMPRHGLVRPGPTMPTVIPEDEVYFWSAGWQEGELAAEADLAAGRSRRFQTADEAIRFLLREG